MILANQDDPNGDMMQDGESVDLLLPNVQVVKLIRCNKIIQLFLILNDELFSGT